MATTVTLKPNAIDISGSTSGTTTLQATAVAGTTTLTLPAATDTLVGKTTTDTLTNKTLTSPTITGTLTTTGNTILGDASTDTLNVGNGDLVKDASGNLGLGVTPSAWGTAWRSLDMFGWGSVASASDNMNVLNNAYITASGSVYKNTGLATRYNQSGGVHSWFNAPSGTAGNAISFIQAMTLSAAGYLGISETSPSNPLSVKNDGTATGNGWNEISSFRNAAQSKGLNIGYNPSANNATLVSQSGGSASGFEFWGYTGSAWAERARISSDGNLLVNTTTTDIQANMLYWNRGGGTAGHLAVANTEATNVTAVMFLNRQGSDGDLVEFRQANTAEGTISVSGTTVSYNGGHLSRWAQTTTAKDDSLVKGTVLSNLDEMNVYTDAEGNPVANEQLNKVKVSDTEGDVNVAGVFVNWSYDEQHSVDEINIAMTGDMIIRIAQGVSVARGDLLMSAGDGTAKPQGDDIVRSKTVAKVTSTHVTCTYADGSYCVPCVLMAC